MYQIKLENTLTHQEYLFECDDIYNGEKLYYKFNINTKELDEGEYKLTLLNDKGKIEAEDVLKIGNFNPSTLQYRSGENIYISNKYNVKIGDKNAVIDSVESVVYPDEEYDAMTSVTINAQGVYDDGYSVGNTEGYNNGYTIGKEEGFDEGYQEGVEIGYQNGFDNGALEQKKFLTNITITENGTYNRDNGYNEVNVNVTTKIDVGKYGIKFAHSTFTLVPDFYVFSSITDMSYMFQDCKYLQKIPFIDTSNASDFSYTFEGVAAKTIPFLNTSKVTNFTYCFYKSKIEEIPSFDYSNGKNFYEFCYYCSNLKYVPDLDLSSATNINGLFENCNALISVGEIKVPNVRGKVTYFLGSSNKNNLTDFGGLIGFRGSITSDGFHTCPNLSYQSCINILNGLYDFTGNGETPSSNEATLKVHSNFLTAVGDEISIGTNKGWTITI